MMNNRYKTINDYIVKINEKLLRSRDVLYHMANPTLSRNPYTSPFLSYYTGFQPVFKITARRKFMHLLRYFAKAGLLLGAYVMRYLIYKAVRKKSPLTATPIVIDTYFLVDKTVQQGVYKENYFLGLDTILEKLGIDYTILVKIFFGNSLGLYRFYCLVRILNTSEKRIVSEFDLLGPADLLKVMHFSLRYPFKLLNAMQDDGSKEADAFNCGNLAAMNGNAFFAYIRYLVGKQSRTFAEGADIISWCEYQDVDKCFYKGVREYNPTSRIYGCQLLVSYDAWLNFYIPPEEAAFNCTPHVILTNGEETQHPVLIERRTGVSLRYRHLFTPLPHAEERAILVLGTFLYEETLHILETVKTKLPHAEIIFRIHPSHTFGQYQKHLPENWLLSVDETLSDALAKSFFVITSGGTGTAMETVCHAKSTLLIGNNANFDSIPLVEMGKGKIWDIVFEKDEVESAYKRLTTFKCEHPEEAESIAQWYKRRFFVEPTESNIIDAFPLLQRKTT